ncbi:ester cyclase [Haloferax sp. DFSO60]|uniref:ester cyclase n=1 Tax=Haloferax sp. DFSO60 TaxID=3388652 RepID=UPI003979E2EC
MAATTTPEQGNQATMMRIASELWNDREYDVVDEVYGEDIEIHAFSDPEGVHGKDGVKAYAQRYHDAFSDFHVELMDVTARDDCVYCRYRVTGTHDGLLRGEGDDIPATNKHMEMWGIVEGRFEDGRVVEEWNGTDTMAMMHQLGLVE